jgi:cytochrome P450
MTQHRLPPGPPAVKNIIHMMMMGYNVSRLGPLALLSNMIKEYGDIAAFDLMGVPQIWTTNAEFAAEVTVKQAANFRKDSDYTDPKKGLARFLGQGLLTSNGEFWKRQRKLVAPALHAKRIEAYAETMVDYTRQLIAKWHDNQHLDISREMNALTMRIVAKTLFNTDVEQVIEMVHRSMAAIQQSAISGQTSPLPGWVPTPTEIRARRAIQDLNEFVYQTIKEWRKKGEDRGDLLSMLLMAEDDEGHHMTDEQARDEILTLFLAGHETTANTLNWTWTLLAQNPDAEAKLHAELDSVLQGRPATLADLRRMPYTEMVVKESMRLRPPAWSFSREAINATQIAGYDIPAGAVCAVFTYGLHRNPKYWGDDAEVFRPERFAPENEDKIVKYAYLPFGAGPRVCIGNSFAMMEAQLLLATMAQKWQPCLAPGQTVEMLPLVTLNPKGGLPMTLQERHPVYAAPETQMESISI